MLKKGLFWIATGYAFNFAETAFFGWNMTAQSVAEKICDNVSIGIILAGFFFIAGYAAGRTVVDGLVGMKIFAKRIDGEEVGQ